MLFRTRYNALFRQFRLLTAQAGSIPAAIRLIFENCYSKLIDQYWEGGGPTRIFKKWILPNLTAFVAFLVIVSMLFWGKNDYSMTQKVLLALVTPLMTMLVQWVNSKFKR